MKQKRYTSQQRIQAHPVLSTEFRRPAASREPAPQRAVAQYSNDKACGAPHTQATTVSAAAIAHAVQTSPSYFSHALSRWSAMWGGTFYDFIAVVERFRSIPSLAALDASISRQLNAETDGTDSGLEGDKLTLPSDAA